MKVNISNTVMKKLSRKWNWWYKTSKAWEVLRYGIPRFFSNIWKFRKELYDYYPWESMYSVGIFRKGLELSADHIEEYGMEVHISRDKKVAKMRRAVEIMKWHEDDKFLELAEKELGYEYSLGSHWFEKIEGETFDNPFGEDGEDLFEWKSDNDEEAEERNKNLIKRSKELEDSTWKELFEILRGQDYENAPSYISHKLDTESKDVDTTSFDDWFDGTGIKGWWD